MIIPLEVRLYNLNISGGKLLIYLIEFSIGTESDPTISVYTVLAVRVSKFSSGSLKSTI